MTKLSAVAEKSAEKGTRRRYSISFVSSLCPSAVCVFTGWSAHTHTHLPSALSKHPITVSKQMSQDVAGQCGVRFQRGHRAVRLWRSGCIFSVTTSTEMSPRPLHVTDWRQMTGVWQTRERGIWWSWPMRSQITWTWMNLWEFLQREIGDCCCRVEWREKRGVERSERNERGVERKEIFELFRC